MKQLKSLFLGGIVFGLTICLFKSYEDTNIAESVGYIIGYTLGYAAIGSIISIIISTLPASIYWLIKRKEMPNLILLRWIILSFISGMLLMETIFHLG